MSSNPIKVSNAFQIGLLGGLGVLTALLIGQAINTIAYILAYVFAAIFIALGLDPIVNWLEHRGMKRGWAIPAVVVSLLVLVGVLVSAVAPTLVVQAGEALHLAPQVWSDLSQSEWVQQLDAQFNGGITHALDSAVAFISNSANWPSLLGGVVQVGITVVNGVTGGLIVMILSLYFMASMSSFQQFVNKLVPASRRDKFIDISSQIKDSIGRYVMGQVSIGFLNAFCGFIFMSIAGVPYALVLATVGFVLSLIPLVGSLGGLVLNSAVAFTVSPLLGFITLIYYAVYSQIEAYVITPRIMRKAVSVPGAVVVVGALAGGALMGILGALVAIPASAAVILIIRQIWMPKQELR